MNDSIALRNYQYILNKVSNNIYEPHCTNNCANLNACTNACRWWCFHTVFNAPKVLLCMRWQRRYFEWVPPETILSEIAIIFDDRVLADLTQFYTKNIHFDEACPWSKYLVQIYHERLCKQQWLKVFARYTHDTAVNGDYRNCINVLDCVPQYVVESVIKYIATILNIKTKKNDAHPRLKGTRNATE